MGSWTNPSPLKLIFAISRPYPIHNFLPGHPPVWLRYRRNEDGTDGGFDTAVERWTKTRRGHSFLVDLLKKEYRTRLPWMSGWRKWEERELKACPKLDPGIEKSTFHDYLCPECKAERLDRYCPKLHSSVRKSVFHDNLCSRCIPWLSSVTDADGNFSIGIERWRESLSGRAWLIKKLKEGWRGGFPLLEWTDDQFSICPKRNPGFILLRFHDYICPRCRTERLDRNCPKLHQSVNKSVFHDDLCLRCRKRKRSKTKYRTGLPLGLSKREERELKACPKLDPGIKKSIFHDYLCPRCKKEKKTKKEERIEKMIVLERERRQQEDLQQKKKADRQRKIARKRAQEQTLEQSSIVHRDLLEAIFWQIGKLVRVLGSVFYIRVPSTSGYQKDSYSRELLRTAHEIEVLSDAYR